MFTALFLTLLLIITDQLSKLFVRHNDFFYLCNSGIAWGIKIPEIIIWVLNIVIILFLGHLWLGYWRQNDIKKHTLLKNKIILFITKPQFYLTLILSGAISNLIDRFYFGCVIDFIDVGFWPVFNLADFYISLGIILLLWQNLLIKNKPICQ